MKHLLYILITISLITLVNANEDIIGKKLFCINLEDEHHQWGGIEFYSEKRAKQYFLGVNDFKITERDREYVASPLWIEFFADDGTWMNMLSRMDLKWTDKECKIIEKEESVKAILESVIIDLEEKTKSLKKI